MERIKSIEAARGIAAILVVLFHATYNAPVFYHHVPLWNIFKFGHAGVDFFFVLSGFIIFYIHADDIGNRTALLPYILKRIIRIYPAYVIISVTMLSLYLLFPKTSLAHRQISDTSFILKSFLLYPQAVPPLLHVAWTLVHEMFFYVVFCVFFISKRCGFVFFGIGGLIVLLTNMMGSKLQFPASFFLSAYNIEFLFGGLAALTINRIDVKAGRPLLISGLILFMVAALLDSYSGIWFSSGLYWRFLYGIPSSLTILGLCKLEKSGNLRVPTSFYVLGSSSYAIYLLHEFSLSISHRLVSKFGLIHYLHPDLVYLGTCFLAVCTGVLFYQLVEKHLLHYFRKLAGLGS